MCHTASGTKYFYRHIVTAFLENRLSFSLLLIVLLASGCATTPNTSPEGTEEISTVAAATEPEPPAAPARKAPPKPNDYPVEPFPEDSMYQLLVAEVAGYRGQYDVALEKYVKMAQETRDAGVAARATRLASYLKQEQIALETAQIWAEAEPESLEAHRHAAELLVRAGQLEQAILHMEAVKNLGGLANFDVFAYRAANLDDAGRAALLTAVTRMLERYPDDEQLMFAKAVLLEQKGDMEGTLELADRLLQLSENINVVILKVNALRDLNRNDDALAFLAETIGSFQQEETESRRDTLKRLRLIYARFLFEGERLDDAKAQYQVVLQESPNDGDILFALALIAMEQEDDNAARDYLNQMIRWNRRVGEARYYLGTIAEKNEEFELAIREYKQVGRGYEFLPAQGRIARLLLDQGRADEMREHLANLRAENPERAAQLTMIEAQAFYDRGQQEEVFAIMDKALEADPDNVDMLYFRAMSGEEFGRLDILERDLGRIIDNDPDNADALNALGYTLTDRTDRHEEALELIERALAIKPNEAAFIDSLGWVHYRLENFELAIKHLRRALELFQNDEVAAHLGEALWAAGNREEAKEVWNKALELAPDSEILLEVIKKFTSP
jgi:tetratricopeptide (TPR) repeat protein